MKVLRTSRSQRALMGVMLAILLLPMTAPFAQAQIFTRKQNNGPKQGMSLGKKVVLLSGAALLYFMWRKHQANAAMKAQQGGQMASGTQNGGQMAASGQPQLYRSKNGGIYYRDAQGTPVWLTVPQQGAQVSASDIQRYAPDYNRYRGPAPSAPAGYQQKSFSEYDSNLLPAGPSTTY